MAASSSVDDRIVDFISALHRRFSVTSAVERAHILAVVDHPRSRQRDGRPQLSLECPSVSTRSTADLGPVDHVTMLVNWYAAVIRAEPSRRPWLGHLHGILIYRTDCPIPDSPAGLFDPSVLPPPTATSELYLVDGHVATIRGELGQRPTEPVLISTFDEVDNVDELFSPENWLAPIVAAIRGTDVPGRRIRAFAEYLGIPHRQRSLSETTDAIVEYTIGRRAPHSADGYVGPSQARMPAAAWAVLIDLVYHPYDLHVLLAGDP